MSASDLEDKTQIETDWLKRWAKFSPTSIAFSDADSGAEYSYGALYYLSCRLASHLREEYKINGGDRVAILATNELEYLALFFATQRLGAILVPINFRLTAREVSHILKDSNPSLVICQSDFRETFNASGSTAQIWAFDNAKDESGESLMAWVQNELALFLKSKEITKIRAVQPKWLVDFAGESQSPCMILYTSGTTGVPKGALLTNSMLFWNSLNTGLRLNLNQSDVSLSFLPFFHTGGWNVLLTPSVHRGARTVLMRKFEAERVLELCEKEKVTVLFGVPTTMEMMARTARFKKADLSSVRYAIVGGEPMPIELIRTWQKKGVPIRQGYGLTEFGPSVFSLNEEDALRKIGSIGFANFYVETRVVNDRGEDVPQGEIGELLLKGPACMAGYWRNETATAQTIRHGWLHTGDLVRVDDEGYFYVAGRKKEMIKSGGENIYPIEVEQVLGSHPHVREVAVIGIPDAKWGEVGKAFISIKAGTKLDAQELLTFCTDKLAKFKIPKHFEFMKDLPKGDSGKILKRVLSASN